MLKSDFISLGCPPARAHFDCCHRNGLALRERTSRHSMWIGKSLCKISHHHDSLRQNDIFFLSVSIHIYIYIFRCFYCYFLFSCVLCHTSLDFMKRIKCGEQLTLRNGIKEEEMRFFFRSMSLIVRLNGTGQRERQEARKMYMSAWCAIAGY